VQPVHRSQTFDADPERTNKMKKTFVDVMLELPVDATLRDFLTGHGLSMPEIDPGDAADANSLPHNAMCACHGERVGGDFERTEGRIVSN
jgi:hypothetical protein